MCVHWVWFEEVLSWLRGLVHALFRLCCDVIWRGLIMAMWSSPCSMIRPLQKKYEKSCWPKTRILSCSFSDGAFKWTEPGYLVLLFDVCVWEVSILSGIVPMAHILTLLEILLWNQKKLREADREKKHVIVVLSGSHQMSQRFCVSTANMWAVQ